MAQVTNYFLWLIFYSVAGWLYETIICSVDQRKLVKRGFLYGPYCPIYGFGAIIDILCLSWVIDLKLNFWASSAVLFFAGVVLTGVLEYFTSWAMEKIFHAKWWDYSRRKFNINGRVCLIGMVVFGTMSVLLLQFIHPWVQSVTARIPQIALYVSAAVIFVGICVDCVFSVINTLRFTRKLEKAQEILNKRISEAKVAADELKKRVQEKVSDMEKEVREVPVQLHKKAAELRENEEKNLAQLREFVTHLTAHERQTLAAFPEFKYKYKDTVASVKEALAAIGPKRAQKSKTEKAKKENETEE